jgi:hypothetical protein
MYWEVYNLNELKDYFTEEQSLDEPMKANLRKTKIVVEEVLVEYEDTRDSDEKLIRQVIIDLTGFDIPLSVLEVMPSFETITRVRRKLNEEGLYLPESKIAENRFSYEEQTREWTRE